MTKEEQIKQEWLNLLAQLGEAVVKLDELPEKILDIKKQIKDKNQEYIEATLLAKHAEMAAKDVK